MTQGYYNNPESTDRALTSDGWVKTGDLGFISESGNLVVTGREKDIIFVNGKISTLTILNGSRLKWKRLT